MDNEIHNFKRKVHAIPIPEDKLDTAITKTISTPRKKNRKLYYLFATAMTLMILLFSSAFVSPVMAKILSQVPWIGSVISYFDTGLENASNEGFVTKIGETYVSQDIPVTITEVYYDDFRLVVGYTIPNVDDLGAFEALDTEVKLGIDNQTVTSMSGHSTLKGDQVIGTIETTATLPDSFTLDVSFSEIFHTKGDWNFRIPVTKNTNTLAYEVGKTKEVNNYKFEVFTIQLAPSGTKIHMELDMPFGDETAYDFLVYNDNGNRLGSMDYTKKIIPLVKFDKQVLKMNALFEPLQDNLITIVPVMNDNGTIIELEELAIEVDLSTIKGQEVSNKIMGFGLREDKVDKKTYFMDYIVEEVASEMGLQLGEYNKAELPHFNLDFAIDFQKEQQMNNQTVVNPIVMIEKKSGEKGYVVYKTENGVNHIFQVELKDENWIIVDSFTLQGKMIRDLEMSYNEE